MQFISVKIMGFLSIGYADLSFDKEGITLVEGINHDSTADSNGAGKSSIFEAIFWAMFGTTRRGVTGDDIINRHAKTGTSVEVIFSAKGVTYRLTRARKAKPIGDEHGVFLEEATGLWLFEMPSTPITKGTARETQALLESIIGMTQLSFQKIVFFGQSDVKPIAELSDAELKMVFEQSLGLGAIQEDAAKVSGYRKAVDSEVAGNVSALAGKRIAIETTGKTVDGLEKAVSEYADDRDARVLALRGKIADLTTTLFGADSHIATKKIDVEKALENVSDAEKITKAMEETRRNFERSAGELASSARVSGAAVTAFSAEIKRLLEKLKAVGLRSGVECESCGVVMDEKAVATSTKRISAEARAIAEKMNAEKEIRDKAAEKVASTKVLAGKFEDKMNAASEILASARKKHIMLSTDYSAALASADARKKELSHLNVVLSSTLASTGSGIAESLESAKMELSGYAGQAEALEEKLVDLSANLETVKMLETALGNAGMKSLIFDTVTPELNKYANDFLAILDPSISVDVSTITKLKTGELREKFSVNVETSCGASGFRGHSGGERQKVNLAISLAFNAVARAAYPDAPNILVLDEPFESLDSGSSEQVMELLQTIKAGNVFLITHNQAVKDLVPNKLTVEKRGGISKIA